MKNVICLLDENVAMDRYSTQTCTGGTAYQGKDVLGSVRGISNEWGQLEEHYEYDAFGKPYKGDLDNGMNLGYTGKPYDTAAGMYNYGYRDYQPEVARFTTVDPMRDGANWFAYVNNDPVNYVDLWGLKDVLLTIYNIDPTPGENTIATSTGEVGHTWMSIDDENRGWGFDGDPRTGASVPGVLLTTYEDNRGGRDITSTYSKTISEEQAQGLEDYWTGLVSSGTKYNLGGGAVDPGATMCTESVVNGLNYAGVLTPQEAAIINAPFEKWEYSFPNPVPTGLETVAQKTKDLTSPNPNVMDYRMQDLQNSRTNCNN
jgi:RHS repeat-associated protein